VLRKRIRIFFRLKAEELIRCLLVIGECIKIVFLGIGILAGGVFGVLLILALLGFLITLVWKYPFLNLMSKNLKSETWPLYIIIGSGAILGPLILFLIGCGIKDFIKLLQNNWEEAGKLAEVEEHDESIKKILKVSTK
jgi:hypothetical protein